MNIEKYISDLLYDHDCVIVPELGGFIASYAHSEVHPVQHVFSAPSKKIAFNVFLKNNDGLLANHVVHFENVTYIKAMSEIKNYVEGCFVSMQKEKKFSIPKVGILFRDVENNLQFEPANDTNYLLSSFGFTAVQSSPILREQPQEKIVKQLKQMKTLRPSVKLEKNRSGRKRKITNTVILSAVGLWFAFNVYLIIPGHFQLSSLNPFSNKEQPVSSAEKKSDASAKNILPEEKKSVVSVAPVKSDLENPETNKMEEIKTDEKMNQEILADDSKIISDKKYFVIAGAFNGSYHAGALVESLHTQGFPEASIIPSDNKYILVSYCGFVNFDDALTELSTIKEKKLQGWVYSQRKN